MQILTTADAAKNVLQCNIANKIVEHLLNESYGIECVDDLLANIDKSSAYLWVLNSGCDISANLLCKILNFANEVSYTLDICNPNNPCVSSKSIVCDLVIIDFTAEECFLPINSINILS